MSGLPTGTVTFLFTDLEGSTRLWEDHPDAMRPALARHDELVGAAIAAHGFHAVFTAPSDALGAAVDAQRALGDEAWGSTGPLRVRMGVHTGVAELREGDYYGSMPNRSARLMSVAHGGQIVCSHATATVAGESPTGGLTLVDLGEQRLRDLSQPEHVFQVGAAGLQSEFPPLTSLDARSTNLPGTAHQLPRAGRGGRRNRGAVR